MITESINRASNIIRTPSESTKIQRVNIDVLKQRLIKQKRKDRVKRTIIFSTVCVSLGALTLLTY